MLTWEVMLREVCNFLDPAPLQNNTEALIYFTSFPSPQEGTQTFEDEEENEEDDEDKDGAKDDDHDDATTTPDLQWSIHFVKVYPLSCCCVNP